MSSSSTLKSYLTPKEVAELLMVSTAAVRLWTENSDLKASVTAGGHRRFKMKDVKQFAIKNNIQLNASRSNTPKILIVDDESDFAHFLKILLTIEIKNSDVEISLDGFDAANKLRDFSPSIVLLDLKMPGLNGFEICQHIKQSPLYKHIRVIAMSGDANSKDIDKVKSVGAETCLSKPIDVPVLLTALALNNLSTNTAIKQ